RPPGARRCRTPRSWPGSRDGCGCRDCPSSWLNATNATRPGPSATDPDIDVTDVIDGAVTPVEPAGQGDSGPEGRPGQAAAQPVRRLPVRRLPVRRLPVRRLPVRRLPARRRARTLAMTASGAAAHVT